MHAASSVTVSTFVKMKWKWPESAAGTFGGNTQGLFNRTNGHSSQLAAGWVGRKNEETSKLFKSFVQKNQERSYIIGSH